MSTAIYDELASLFRHYPVSRLIFKVAEVTACAIEHEQDKGAKVTAADRVFANCRPSYDTAYYYLTRQLWPSLIALDCSAQTISSVQLLLLRRVASASGDCRSNDQPLPSA